MQCPVADTIIEWPTDAQAEASKPLALKMEILENRRSGKVCPIGAAGVQESLGPILSTNPLVDGHVDWDPVSNVFTSDITASRNLISGYTGKVMVEQPILNARSVMPASASTLSKALDVMPASTLRELAAAVEQAPAAPLQSKSDGRDTQKDFCCACIYAPAEKDTAYNHAGETRFRDICKAQVEDTKRQDLVKCQDAAAFPYKGKEGELTYPGLQEWVKSVVPEKCTSIFIMSERHGNGYYDWVRDIFEPSVQCVKAGPKIKCIYHFEASCSGYSYPRSLCWRAKKLREDLEELKCNTYFEIVAARQENATPGTQFRVDETGGKLTQSNPDGSVELNAIWRNLVVTRKSFWLYRHKPGKDKKGSWTWERYSRDDFQRFCTGHDPFDPTNRFAKDDTCPAGSFKLPEDWGSQPPKKDGARKTIVMALWTNLEWCHFCRVLDEKLPELKQKARAAGFEIVVRDPNKNETNPNGNAVPGALIYPPGVTDPKQAVKSNGADVIQRDLERLIDKLPR